MGGLKAGGVESFVMNLYRAIDRTKVQFDFVKHTTEVGVFDKEIEKLGGKIHICPQYKGTNHFAYWKWWELFFKKHQEYIIIHGHVRSTAVIYLWEAKRQGRYTIAHSHSTTSGSGVAGIIKNVMQYPIRFFVDQFFGCSQKANEWLFGKKVANSAKCKIIRNAVFLEKYAYQEKVAKEVRYELNINNGDLVLGNIGRLVEEKNQTFLLDILAEVLEVNQQAVLIIVGAGKLEKKLKLYAEELNVTQKVEFLGSREDVPRLLQAIDVFLFPSLYEGLGIVAIEAQAAGLKTIVSQAIPNEAAVTDLFIQIDINNKSKWVEEILKSKHILRSSEEAICRLERTGYNIKEVAAFLQDFYNQNSRIGEVSC